MYNHIHPKTKNHKTTFRNGFYRKLSLNKSLDFFSFHIQTYNIMRLRIHYALQKKKKIPFVYIYTCSVSRGALSFLLWRARLPQSAVFYNKFFNIHFWDGAKTSVSVNFPKNKKKMCVCIWAVIMCRRMYSRFFIRFASSPYAFIRFSHFHIFTSFAFSELRECFFD